MRLFTNFNYNLIMASVHEIKSEPLEGAEGVHEDLDEDIIKSVEHTSNNFF